MAVPQSLTPRSRFIADMTRIKQIVWSVRSDSGDDRLLVREAMVGGERLSRRARAAPTATNEPDAERVRISCEGSRAHGAC